ncbi:MAG: tetratricopeptide repeat protein [Flavobacteriales bacterium]|nr:tetratricopeptide repeat protein [Flavobacteriales bacterium]
MDLLGRFSRTTREIRRCHCGPFRCGGIGWNRDEVYLNMAYSLRTLGRLEEAKDCLQRALAITPDYPEAHEELADITVALSATSEG